MRIKIIRTFTDLQAKDPEKAEIEAGSEITVTAERGAELIGLGLAEDLGDGGAPKTDASANK